MADKYVAYVGTYTRGDSDGIYIYDLDPDKALLTNRRSVWVSNPSFLRLSYNQQFLYCDCDEGVAAFKIRDDGVPEFINRASVKGLRPCYISVNRANTFMITGGYHDGKLTVLKINEDGTIGEVVARDFMKGMGSITGKNYRTHVNCAVFSPDERYIFATDPGTDQVKIYDFDSETGEIELHDILRCQLETGPKHLLFSDDGKYAYLTFEYASKVNRYAYDAETGHFEELQSLSTAPEGYTGYNTAITLKFTGDGKYLYVTNSGNNSVAVYRINPGDEPMEKLFVLPISGEYPRDIAIMPNNEMFLSVNQEGYSITSFRSYYDRKYIAMINEPVAVSSPTCIAIKKL